MLRDETVPYFLVNPSNQLLLGAGGPSGIVLDEERNQLYVFTRINNGISVIDLEHFVEKDTVTLLNPEPASIVAGRPFLYDATLTSGFGDASCSSCHVYGDMDGLAWDLGNPNSEVGINPNDYTAPNYQRPAQRQLHPLKGPMVTQSMRGIANSGETIFQSDRLEEHHTLEELQEIAAEPTQELTFTCVPPGSGIRIGIDRDEDGTYDADERVEGRRDRRL